MENTNVITNEYETFENPEKNNKRKHFVHELFEWIEIFAIALAIVVLVFTFLFRHVMVEGQSMEFTLEHGDKLIISHLLYTPTQGDIVVVQIPALAGEPPFIKRVIAVGGVHETVTIHPNGDVYVDGKRLDEPYLRSPAVENALRRLSEPKTWYIDPGYIFVLGDNRGNSTDSRDVTVGQIEEVNIVGRVIFRLWPNFGTVN